ncbi:MAG: hypothetical protein ACREF3_18855 [Acetobacteraceae bacterium]
MRPPARARFATGDDMSPWIKLSQARTPDGDCLVLRRSGDTFEIRCNGWELMSNRAHHSEETLGRLAVRHLSEGLPAVLIGGLGMGFTLRAALDALPLGARVTVAELLPEIVSWNRGCLAGLAGDPLEDRRVTMVCRDVADLLRETPAGFDAIVLDVDNGPGAPSTGRNRQLYSAGGLSLIRRALRPSGLLAVWAADPWPPFEDALGDVGLRWRSVRVPARGTPGDPEHTIYLACRPPCRARVEFRAAFP